MAQLLLLRGAKQLLTLRGPSGVRRGAALNDLGIIEDGSILIQDGRIVSVGPTRRLENLKEAKGAIDIPVHGAVVMPGFVDPAIYASIYQNSSDQAGWRRKKTQVFVQESLTLIRSCLQHGTLNAQFKVYSDSALQAADLAALRHLARIGDNPVGTVRSLRLAPSAFDEGHAASFIARLATLRRGKLAQFIELVAGDDLPNAERFLELLGRAGIPLNLVWRSGAPDLLRKLVEATRARSVSCPAELSAEDCLYLAQSPAIAVFSPCKDLLEERENPSVKKLVAAGGAIALGSGYDSNDAPIFSMQMVVALAVLRLRLSVEQAITATTINAAHALGIGEEVGSLEAGKRADLLVLSLSDYRELPRRIGVNQVVMAIRDGNFVINRKRAKVSAV